MSAAPGLSAEDVIGAEVTAARWCETTGLLCLALHRGDVRWRLGIGIGPHAVGVGRLPATPRFTADRNHPLVAGLRAHLVGRQVTEARLEAQRIVVIGSTGDGASSDRVELTAEIGRRGRLTLLAEGRRIAQLPPDAGASPPRDVAATCEAPREDSGLELLSASDRHAETAAWHALRRAVRRSHRRLERRREAIASDLARAETIPQLERAGHLLLAHGSQVPRGAREAVLADWETGEPVHIPLDPTQPAAAQAPSFFARARRLKRGMETMRERLRATERSLSEMGALRADVEAPGDGTDPEREIAARWARATALGVRPSGPRTSPSAPKAAARRPFVRYLGARGRPILVGRGAQDNDALTLRTAKPGDLFLHVRGVTGAHVIVPKPKGEACPSELLVDAATLAAHFSDARGEAQLDVSYVERRYVRKPRKSPAGAVVLERQKVLHLRVDPERLRRLLATKEC